MFHVPRVMRELIVEIARRSSWDADYMVRTLDEGRELAVQDTKDGLAKRYWHEKGVGLGDDYLKPLFEGWKYDWEMERAGFASYEELKNWIEEQRKIETERAILLRT